jgi:hypothetical protein
MQASVIHDRTPGDAFFANARPRNRGYFLLLLQPFDGLILL